VKDRSKRDEYELFYDVLGYVQSVNRCCKKVEVQMSTGMNYYESEKIVTKLIDMGLIEMHSNSPKCILITEKGKVIHTKLAKLMKMWGYEGTRYDGYWHY
jgi:predicted transcriptional regulator